MKRVPLSELRPSNIKLSYINKSQGQLYPYTSVPHLRNFSVPCHPGERFEVMQFLPSAVRLRMPSRFVRMFADFHAGYNEWVDVPYAQFDANFRLDFTITR